jgi:hypothetical protein
MIERFLKRLHRSSVLTSPHPPRQRLGENCATVALSIGLKSCEARLDYWSRKYICIDML